MTSTELTAPEQPALRRIFDNRLVRLIAFFFATILAYAGAQILPIVAMPRIAPADRVPAAMAFETGSVLALLVLYWLLVRSMEHRPALELSLRKAPALIPLGVLVGAGLFASTIAVLALMGVAYVDGFAPERSLVAATNMAILAGVGEELVFRGALFRICEEMFGTLVALLVSAALFGAIHLANPGATPASGAAIALEAGLLLAACYAAARSLWLPIGLHFGWNFAESGIFGSVVSGNAFKGLFHTTLSGPETLTGGRFGPEASAVAVAICALAALAFLLVAVRRGEWVGLRVVIRDRSA
ncbi:MAG TPA: CPBP family intramembrane glutamic endopeptidase [Rhizomicrobium sp.]|nr:CPBP family intramembrane glutamic endopeptidase [Rhizomicrobium sp.]